MKNEDTYFYKEFELKKRKPRKQKPKAVFCLFLEESIMLSVTGDQFAHILKELEFQEDTVKVVSYNTVDNLKKKFHLNKGFTVFLNVCNSISFLDKTLLHYIVLKEEQRERHILKIESFKNK